MSFVPICYVLSLAPVLQEAGIESTSITEQELMYHARIWRRAHGERIGALVATTDSKLQHLIDEIDAIPIVEPELTFDEITALLFLMYEHRNDEALSDDWKLYCSWLKTGKIPFDVGLLFFINWMNHVIPQCKPTACHLERFCNNVRVLPQLSKLYAQCTGQPVKTWTSGFEFYKAFVEYFGSHGDGATRVEGNHLVVDDLHMWRLADERTNEMDKILKRIIECAKNKNKE